MIRLKETLLASFIVFSSICSCSPKEGTIESADIGAIAYDSLLAAELGADNYGMRQYILAILKSTDKNDLDSVQLVQLQQGHMANIRRMGATGDLVLAGPFIGQREYRGVYIFDVATVEEAIALTQTDPAVQAGVLKFEMYPWYASAALKKVRSIGQTLKKPTP